MGRAWREEYVGGIYHVIARGNNYRIYGYVLMDNHYHLLIQTMDKKLQEMMHQINNKYSKYFNYKYKRVGHVFQGRYKSIIVQDERYLLSVLRYIHQNPIKAYMCQSVDDYKWSSDIFYRRDLKGFVNLDIVLNMLDIDRKESIRKYKELMKEYEEVDYENGKVIGDEAYQLMCLSKRKKEDRKRLDEILIDTGVNNEDYELIKSGSRKRKLTKYKLSYAKSALALRYTYKEIAQNIRITESSVKDLIYKTERLSITD